VPNLVLLSKSAQFGQILGLSSSTNRIRRADVKLMKSIQWKPVSDEKKITLSVILAGWYQKAHLATKKFVPNQLS